MTDYIYWPRLIFSLIAVIYMMRLCIVLVRRRTFYHDHGINGAAEIVLEATIRRLGITIFLMTLVAVSAVIAHRSIDRLVIFTFAVLTCYKTFRSQTDLRRAERLAFEKIIRKSGDSRAAQVMREEKA